MTKKSKKTITARQLVSDSGQSVDRIYTFISQHGMDPRKLYPKDVSLINRELETESQNYPLTPVETNQSSPSPELEEDSIVRFTRKKDS